MIKHSSPTITGVILAGGRATRMGGHDKGLVNYNGKPLIETVISSLYSQVDQLVINANRNLETYQAYHYPVINDVLDDFCGPLSGMLSAMKAVDSDYILTVPCDAPAITSSLRQRMMETLLYEQSDIAVAFDGERLQPVFCLIPTRLADNLAQFLANGDRKIDLWLSQHTLSKVNFSDQPDTFVNFNKHSDIEQFSRHIHSPLPMIGFAAFSGTGKTTLLRQLIPSLINRGVQLAVIKHAYHKFDIDIPGKDSYEIRQAGAQQVLVSSSRLMALMEVESDPTSDPKLSELIPRLNLNKLDLILVEGFKHELFTKIELHRPSLGHPLLYKDDPNIKIIATDQQIKDCPIEQLDLNDVEGLADYIHTYMNNWKQTNG
jgi:molybdopterin-guanine dinucleotide biosynthesis protein